MLDQSEPAVEFPIREQIATVVLSIALASTVLAVMLFALMPWTAASDLSGATSLPQSHSSSLSPAPRL